METTTNSHFHQQQHLQQHPLQNPQQSLSNYKKEEEDQEEEQLVNWSDDEDQDSKPQPPSDIVNSAIPNDSTIIKEKNTFNQFSTPSSHANPTSASNQFVSQPHQGHIVQKQAESTLSASISNNSSDIRKSSNSSSQLANNPAVYSNAFQSSSAAVNLATSLPMSIPPPVKM